MAATPRRATVSFRNRWRTGDACQCVQRKRVAEAALATSLSFLWAKKERLSRASLEDFTCTRHRRAVARTRLLLKVADWCPVRTRNQINRVHAVLLTGVSFAARDNLMVGGFEPPTELSPRGIDFEIHRSMLWCLRLTGPIGHQQNHSVTREFSCRPGMLISEFVARKNSPRPASRPRGAGRLLFQRTIRIHCRDEFTCKA